ncbi:hypothetical protein AAFH68_49570 [Flavobacterium sp. CGRL1]
MIPAGTTIDPLVVNGGCCAHNDMQKRKNKKESFVLEQETLECKFVKEKRKNENWVKINEAGSFFFHRAIFKLYRKDSNQ